MSPTATVPKPRSPAQAARCTGLLTASYALGQVAALFLPMIRLWPPR